MALDAVTSGMTVRAAAEKFYLARSAVGRLRVGETKPDGTAGRPQIVPAAVELKIVAALLRMSQAHLGLTPVVFRATIGHFLVQNGFAEDGYSMTETWYASFMQRHKVALSPLKGRNISKARSDGFNRLALTQYITFIEPLLARYTPEEIFNVDHTGVTFENEGMTVRLISNFPRQNL